MSSRLPLLHRLPFAAGCLGIALFSIMDAVMKHLVWRSAPITPLCGATAPGALIAGIFFLAGASALAGPGGDANPRDPGPRRHRHGAALLLGPRPRAARAGDRPGSYCSLIALFLASVLLKERIERRAIFASASAWPASR
jgi:hypothetical protein